MSQETLKEVVELARKIEGDATLALHDIETGQPEQYALHINMALVLADGIAHRLRHLKPER